MLIKTHTLKSPKQQEPNRTATIYKTELNCHQAHHCTISEIQMHAMHTTVVCQKDIFIALLANFYIFIFF